MSYLLDYIVLIKKEQLLVIRAVGGYSILEVETQNEIGSATHGEVLMRLLRRKYPGIDLSAIETLETLITCQGAATTLHPLEPEYETNRQKKNKKKKGDAKNKQKQEGGSQSGGNPDQGSEGTERENQYTGVECRQS